MQTVEIVNSVAEALLENGVVEETPVWMEPIPELVKCAIGAWLDGETFTVETELGEEFGKDEPLPATESVPTETTPSLDCILGLSTDNEVTLAP